ncbi:MAG TPA: glycosyltransferase family 39 protein [Micromonosporaceae bacterium]
MAKSEATTIVLRTAREPTVDLWGELLRSARRVETGSSRDLVWRWLHWLAPAVLTSLLAAIGLARPGLWTDELATWGMATTPWSQFWPVLRYVDAVLAPYYTFMHLWVSVFGDSDVALRVPSVLAMAASAGLVAVIGDRLAGHPTGMIAGLLFAALPSTSRFAAEARPYALTVLVACLATWLLLLAWERPTAARWIGYGAALTLLGWLNIVALLLLAAHGWAVFVCQRQAWRRFILTSAVAAAATAPILLYGVQQRHQVAYIPEVNLATMLGYGDVLFGSMILAALIIGLSLFSLPLRFPSALFAAWAVVPALVLIVVSFAVPMFLPRYLLFTTPAWALLAGAALARLRPGWGAVGVVLIAALAVPVQVQLRGPGGHERQATRQAAAVVAQQVQPGDGIVYADNEPIGAWTTRDAINHYLAPSTRPRDVLLTRPPRTGGLLLGTECPEVARCLGSARRLWVVRTGQLSDPLAGLGPVKQQALAQDYRIAQLWYPSGMTVALLERTRSPR